MNIETIYERTMAGLEKHVDENVLKDLNDYYSIFSETYLLGREEVEGFVEESEFKTANEFEVHSGSLSNNDIVNVIIHGNEMKLILMDEDNSTIYCGHI